MNNKFPFNKFTLFQTCFNHPSQLHGINHTYRVMSHIINLCEKHNLNIHLPAALTAAFIHDMARQHDGYCTEHGKWAVEKKMPLFRDFFKDINLNENEIEQIAVAVEYHSLPDELEKDHPAYIVTALLKDADALDRVRLGDDNLDPGFLRLEKSKELIGFAKKLFLSSSNIKFSSFTEVLEFAKLINQK